MLFSKYLSDAYLSSSRHLVNRYISSLLPVLFFRVSDPVMVQGCGPLSCYYLGLSNHELLTYGMTSIYPSLESFRFLLIQSFLKVEYIPFSCSSPRSLASNSNIFLGTQTSFYWSHWHPWVEYNGMGHSLVVTCSSGLGVCHRTHSKTPLLCYCTISLLVQG